jgi:hypothetical protein
MRTWTAAFLLLCCFASASLEAQSSSTASAPPASSEESIDSNQPPPASDTSTTTSASPASASPTLVPTPAWIHLVRTAATGGPIVFLLLAWSIGVLAHFRLVRREQALFPAVRGTRSPQTVPMVISAALFIVPAVLFVFFEVRSRSEIRNGISGVVDEWHPVTVHAWTLLVICLVLALVPWLFARRADTVS